MLEGASPVGRRNCSEAGQLDPDQCGPSEPLQRSAGLITFSVRPRQKPWQSPWSCEWKRSAEEAVTKIQDGASLLIGGFMAVGPSERVIDEIVRQGKRELTVIANDTALPGVGVGKLISAKLVRKVIASHIGLNPETQQQMWAAI